MPILCATNFSTEAIAATTVAAELARQRGEDLWLVFVMPGNTARAFGDQVMSTADQALKGEADRARKLGATVIPAVLVGKLHRELPRFAAENKVTLVIAGDKAREPGSAETGALARLGQHLEAPLLVVRESARLIAWAKGLSSLKVMVGVDQTRSTEIAARWIEQLSKFGKLELLGAHVFFPAAESHRLGLPLPRGWNDVHPELLGALHRELSSKLPAMLPHRIRLEPAIGRISDHLSALAADEHVDLLVLGTHHRRALGRLWSVSEQCLQSAQMSVVCVPAAQGEKPVEAAIPIAERVLIATDLTPLADRAIAWGLGVLAPGGAADLVHVSATPLTADDEQKIVAQLIARIPHQARTRGGVVHAHALVSSNAGHAIAAAAERFGSSVICLGSRGASGLSKFVFGSTAQALFEVTRRPVLIVPPPEV